MLTLESKIFVFVTALFVFAVFGAV